MFSSLSLTAVRYGKYFVEYYYSEYLNTMNVSCSGTIIAFQNTQTKHLVLMNDSILQVT